MVDLVCGERINEEDYNSPLLLPSRDENDYHIKLVLGAEDDEGNPLHLAASMGNVEMCKKISGVDPLLIAKRNNASETPLFMAALHGHIKPFLWLYCGYMGIPGVSSTDIAHCIKRDNGDTILHCALEGGHIDVAIEIVLLYKSHLKEMVLMHNQNGLSPIHLLAVLPSAFQSTHIPTLPLVAQLLYYNRFQGFPDDYSFCASRWDAILNLLCVLAALLLLPLLVPEAGSTVVDTPLLIAAQNGITEMVEKILDYFPSNMSIVNEEGKNTVLIAAEKRQTTVYKILCENKNVDKSAFRQVDRDGNTSLHLAAKPEVNLNKRTTTMVEEYKWFEFVKNSLDFELREKYNNGGKTADDIFIDSYGDQVSRDREWLNQTSEACSVASTLVASMAFANVTVNFDEKNNFSLVALSLSLTSTISFLAILASRSESLKFWRYVPFMLHIAIFAMFGSIVSLWISLMLHDHSFKTYAILGLPIAILTIVSLPIFIGPTLMSMFTKVPSPSNKTTSAIHYRRPQKMETQQKNAGYGTDRRKKFRRKLLKAPKSGKLNKFDSIQTTTNTSSLSFKNF
ncbi:hypothetical protein K1719_035061 [Acacia pycnantha]|nr:hypothetical protein K1719_035061 [Acacia pycnantha]